MATTDETAAAFVAGAPAVADEQDLRRCVRDLVALSTLPAVWRGYRPLRMAESLADVLLSALDLDFAYIELDAAGEGGTRGRHVIRVAGYAPADPMLREFAARVGGLASCEAERRPSTVLLPKGEASARVTLMPLGHVARRGVIVAGSRRATFPSETERLRLGVGANQAAILLERQEAERLTREAKEAAELHGSQLQGVARAAVSIATAPSVGDALRAATEAARHVIGAHQAVTSMTRGPDWTQAVTTVALSDKYAEYRGRGTTPYGPGMQSLVCRTNGPMRMTHRELASHGRAAMADDHLPMRGWLAVPLVGREGENIGLIQLSDKYDGEFTVEDESILTQFAQMVSAVIENGRLNEALREYAARLNGAMEAEQAARQTAEAANLAKDRFLAVLSHELRTPLTPVALVATALEADPGLPDEFRDDVSLIRRNVELETRLIDDLLDLSRITSGKLQLNIRAVAVHVVIGHVLETVGPDLQERRLNVGVELSAGDDRVDADAARLQQALWNLLKNAAKFTPVAGRVTVRTRNEADQLVIEVADTGRGIPAAKLTGIFEPFEQGGLAVTQQYGGIGLGLAIARAVIEQHGGTIAAASEGDGRGSTFTISLPVSGRSSPIAPAGGAELACGVTRPLRLLLVEDHAETAKLLSRLLRSDGSEVRWAGTIAEALRLARLETFDLLVSDLGLPDGTGCELMRQIRTEREMIGIAMSGYGMEEDVRQSRDAGFSEHLIKPVNLPQLRQAIRRVTSGLVNER